jgi:O-antigen/teichoic acid export membrane protein
MPRWSEFDLPFIKPLMKISFHFFLIQLTALIIFASIPFILSQLLNPSHATEYNLANSIFNIPLLVMGVLCNPITPLVTQAFVQSDKKWLRQILRKFNFYVLILISITWILFLFSQSIYGLWIGNKVSINGGLVFWIAIYTSVNLFLQPYTNIYNGIGKLGVVAFLSPIGVCIFLFSAYYLTRYFNNSTGVVMGLILSSLIGLIYIPVKVFKEIRNLK